MPLDTYANLSASILSWLARPDDPLVAPAVPDIIQLFEREAMRRLKVGGAEKRASLTALSAAVALPADFGELRLATSGGVVLTYVPPMQLPGSDGPPAHYTIVGNEMRLGPSPSGGCTVEIVYQSGVPPLSDSNPSNWLLAAHPDCYLFGSLVEAEGFIGSDERIPLWAQRREAAFASIESADRKARWGGAPLSIRADGVSGGNGTAAGDWTSAPPIPIPIAGLVAGNGLTGGGTEGIVTIALDTPVSVADGGTGNTFFGTDLIVTGSGAGALQSTSGRLDGLGDAYARSFATEGLGRDGGLWWGKYGGGFWKWALWSDAGDVAHLERWEADSPVGDALTIDHATSLLDVSGGVNGVYVVAKGNGADGGLWWQGAAGNRWSTWYATAGTARLGLFESDTTTPAGDVLTVDLATRGASFAVSPQAPTPPPGDNDTSLATTAFVGAALSAQALAGDVTGPTANTLVARLQGRPVAATAPTSLQVLQWSGTNWAPATIAAGGTLTGITAGTGIAVSGVAPSPTVALTVPVAVANGGTGAITAGAALTALGAAPLASPVFTGDARAVTPATADNDTSIATTAFVKAQGYQTGNQTITLSGDISGSGTAAITATLPTVNANVGTFQGLTVNGKGLVTAAANQSYLTASGVSGMTAGQIPIAATATTVTSSGNLSGAVTTSGSLATTLAANAVATANITNANVTYAKIQNVAANRLLGNSTGSAAAPAEIALPLAVTLGGTGAATLAASNQPGTANLANALLLGNGTGNVTTMTSWGTFDQVGLANYNAGATAPYLDFGHALGTLAAPSALTSGTALGIIQFDGYGASAWGAAARGQIQCTASENWSGTVQGTRLEFSATPAGGLVTAIKMTIANGVTVGAPTGGDKGAGTLNATTVYGAGTVLTSDARLKRDIEALPETCLPLVEAIAPVSYRWREPDDPTSVPEGFAERWNWGFLAQDVAIAAGAHRNDGGVEGVDVGGLVATLWQAVRELSAKVAALEGKPA